MKLHHILAFFLLPLFLCGGCPDATGFPRDRIDGPIYSFQPLGWPSSTEGGTSGEWLEIRTSPIFSPRPRCRVHMDGPGRLFYPKKNDDPDFPPVWTPFEEIADNYFHNGLLLLYVPPPNDEVPQEGIDVTIFCEVLDPYKSEETWVRSPDYKIRIHHRDKPMDFYIRPNSGRPGYSNYGPDNSFSDETVAPGEIYERFMVKATPAPFEDMQFKSGLVRPSGYSGDLGILEADRFDAHIFTYTAPDVSQPVDIVARFSIYDPWAKETRLRELTFHVVPK